jgi:hypothetical protein
MKCFTTSATQLLVTGLMTVALGVLGPVPDAAALEKYGRPLPEMEKQNGKEAGKEPSREDETLIGGYLLAGAFISNPSFAARPDNTGRVGMRYMLHAETDLYKKYLTFYSDQNFFSDRDNGWIELSEWDQTYGITGTVDHWFWRIQYERDAPLDKSGLKQIYADGLVNYRMRAEEDWAWWRRMFPKNNLTVYAGAGWLFHNDQYFARPDNTGRALFRYVAHFDLELYKHQVVLFGDVNMFTDREASSVVTPSEIDWILGLAVRWRDYEISLYREQDRPVGQSTLIQEYWAVQLRYAFDFQKR